MRFDVLGSLRVTDCGRVVEIPRPKERAVLAALLVDAGSVVPLDRLVNQLWGDEPPARAVGTLHAYISNLRRLLEPERPPRAPSQLLISRAPGYCLAVADDDLDARRFERLVAEAREQLAAGDPATALARYDEALALWRGPAYADFVYDDFALPAARRLEELQAAAVDDRVDALLALGRSDAAIAELEARLVVDPLRERMWAQLVVALYRSGRQAESLAACRRAREALDELGLEPGPPLRSLEVAVLNQSPDLDLAPATVALPSPREPVDDRRLDAGSLVGRDAELLVVDEALDDAFRGKGGALLIDGDAGIGKTAIATEALRRAAARGAVTATARCPETQSAPLLWPWAQLLRQLGGGATPAALSGLLDEVQGGASTRHAPLAAAVLHLLRELAANRPVVVLLDDVQWADEASHRLLQLAVADVVDTGVLVIVTIRTPVDSTPALDESLSTLRRAPARELTLRGLGADETGRLLREVVADAPDEVAAAVHDRTGGNPFFTVELARLLGAERTADVESLAAAGVPSSVRDVVRRRLARLPQQANALLAVAAVVGPDVDVRVVERVADVDEDTVLDVFELATVAGVLGERSDRPGVYRFAHDLVREAIGDALPGLRRARLSSRAHDATLELYGDTRAVAHELARHAVAAVPAAGAAQAIDRLFTSARVALSDLEFGLAERQGLLAERLLEELPPSPDRDRLEVQLHSRLGQYVFHSRGDLAEANRRHEHALRLCAPDDITQLGGVLLGIGAYAPLQGRFQVGVDAGHRLLAAAVAPEHGELRAAGHYMCAMSVWLGDVSGALQHTSQAMDEADRATVALWTSVPKPILRALHTLVEALAGNREWRDQALLAVTEAARERAQWTLCWATTFTVVGAIAADDRDTCAELLELGAAAIGALDYVMPVLTAAQAWVDRRGADDVRRAAQRLAQLGDGMFRAPVLTVLSDVLADERRVDAARDARAEAEQVARSFAQAGWLPVIARARVGTSG